MKKWWLFLLLYSACQSPSREVTPGFYHWQTTLEVSSSEAALLDSLAVERLYLRFFDLDWDAARQEVIPLAPLQLGATRPSTPAIIPTIFITNRSWLHLPDEALPQLVEKVAQKIRQQQAALGKGYVFPEVQFDCDWTARTQASYFRFLTLIKTAFPEQQLSATIRLHQIKYPDKTGVPPVARGMLMCYNMDEVADPTTHNSIFDWSVTQAYLGRLSDYPLALDLALPIFAWAVVFRDGKLTRLIHNLRRADLSDTTRFKMVDEVWVELRKSTYLQGHYLYQGDRLRLEAVEPETLRQAAAQLSIQLSTQQLSLVYYHLDSTTLNHFSYAHFQGIQAAFQN